MRGNSFGIQKLAARRKKRDEESQDQTPVGRMSQNTRACPHWMRHLLPRGSPRKAKGVNSTQPSGNANLEQLGRPNRLFHNDHADDFKIKGMDPQSQVMQYAPVYGQHVDNDLLSSDIPSPWAVSVWQRAYVPADTPMIDSEVMPQLKSSFWEKGNEQQVGTMVMEEARRYPESRAETEQSRPTFLQAIGLHASSSSPYSPLPIRLADSMGATKRLSNGEPKHIGPNPSQIRVSTQYISQNAVESTLRPPNSQGEFDAQERSIAEAREDSMRLQGCTWIDNVRRALQLPIRSYTTACVYYHKFRLANPGILNGMEYGNSWADACAASLLTSCKTEDTLKKSRDILAAAYNLKASPHDQVGSDDSMFDAPSRAVIGLERMVLESGGFDFRSKYPHKLLMKISKRMPEGEDDEKEKVAQIAWSILTDLFRTFAPLKQTAATMAFASLELAAHLIASSSPNNISAIRDELQQYDIGNYAISREEIMETILDALDMYTQHTASTILGTKYSLDDFLRIRLAFNKECNEKVLPRHTIAQNTNTTSNGSTLRVANGHPTPVSPPQPGTLTQQQNNAQQTPEASGTVRFVLNPQHAAEEKVEVQKYFVEEYEDYEEEIEVPTPRLAEQTSKDNPRGERSEKGTPRAKDANDSDKERLRDRDREAERERARNRDHGRERDGPRERRFEERRHDDRFDDRDRRFDDRRDRRFEERRYEDDRRRREDRR